MPFVLLLCGLLGGALVSALVISTTLAEGSYQISKLQSATAALARQKQVLEEQVATDQSPVSIEQRAAKLGMKQAGVLEFINLKTGETLSDAANNYLKYVNVPGYTP